MRDFLERQIEISLERDIFVVCGKMRTALAERASEIIRTHQKHALEKAIIAVRVLEMSAKDDSAREAFQAVLVVLGGESQRVDGAKKNYLTPEPSQR